MAELDNDLFQSYRIIGRLSALNPPARVRTVLSGSTWKAWALNHLAIVVGLLAFVGMIAMSTWFSISAGRFGLLDLLEAFVSGIVASLFMGAPLFEHDALSIDFDTNYVNVCHRTMIFRRVRRSKLEECELVHAKVNLMTGFSTVWSGYALLFSLSDGTVFVFALRNTLEEILNDLQDFVPREIRSMYNGETREITARLGKKIRIRE